MTVICSSSDPKQLRAMLASFDAKSIRGVISFGVAGGLDPTLESGDVVIATDIVAGAERWLAGVEFSRSLLADSNLSGRRVTHGSLVGVEKVIAGRAEKILLRDATGAAAVDMESHIAADYAARAGLPFAAVRVISDPATRALPELAPMRSSRTATSICARCCAGSPAIRRCCVRWSRPAATSTALCAACADAVASSAAAA